MVLKDQLTMMIDERQVMGDGWWWWWAKEQRARGFEWVEYIRIDWQTEWRFSYYCTVLYRSYQVRTVLVRSTTYSVRVSMYWFGLRVRVLGKYRSHWKSSSTSTDCSSTFRPTVEWVSSQEDYRRDNLSVNPQSITFSSIFDFSSYCSTTWT
jgi:hypothetical protein